MKPDQTKTDGTAAVSSTPLVTCPRCHHHEFVRALESNYGDYHCDLCRRDFTRFGTVATKHTALVSLAGAQ